jgi:hypothetical protein
MIRTKAFQPAAARRIAVIGIPRPQQARLGRLGIIRNATAASIPGAVAWTTISDQVPDSADNFLSSVIQSQNAAILATPGTLTYTPASVTPPQNVAPWNSWLQPNCYPDATDATTAAAAPVPQTPVSPFWWVVGILGAAASATYLYEQAKKAR